jgi:hypothetical protein
LVRKWCERSIFLFEISPSIFSSSDFSQAIRTATLICIAHHHHRHQRQGSSTQDGSTQDHHASHAPAKLHKELSSNAPSLTIMLNRGTRSLNFRVLQLFGNDACTTLFVHDQKRSHCHQTLIVNPEYRSQTIGTVLTSWQPGRSSSIPRTALVGHGINPLSQTRRSGSRWQSEISGLVMYIIALSRVASLET